MKKKIIQITFLILSLSVLFYTFYKSEIVWESERRSYYITYYFFGLLFLLIFFILKFLKLKDILIDYFIIFFISLLTSAYSFEIYLLYFKKDNQEILRNIKNKKIKIFKEKYGKDYETRSRLDFYNEKKKDIYNIAVTVHPFLNINNENLDIFPLSGVSNSPTITCNENGYYPIIETDRYGFNNPDFEWENQITEFFFVGDSFAFGECLNRPNDIASVLRKISNKSVLNLAYSGNGPLIQYATMREYLPSNVKNIIWFYFEGNDIIDLKNELNSKILNKYLTNSEFNQNLKSKQDIIDKIAQKMIDEKNFIFRNKDKNKKFNFTKFLKLYESRKLLNKFLPKKNQPKNNLVLPEEFKLILELSKTLAEKNKSKFYFVYLPEYSRYKSKYKNDNYFFIKSILDELNIPFIDIDKEVFKKQKDPLNLFPFNLSGHYNDEGYRKIAEVIHDLSQL